MQIHRFILFACATIILSGCSLTKYVPENERLLSRNTIKSNVPEVPSDILEPFLQQEPNNYFLSVARIELALYSCSGEDTSKWVNRWLRQIGEPPVIYDTTLTRSSQQQLEKQLGNKGYLHAKVNVVEKEKNRQVKITYIVNGNEPYTIHSYKIEIPDDTIMSIIKQRNILNTPTPGGLFDVDLLAEERENVAKLLRRRGYFYFQKEALSFTVDSALNSNQVDILLGMQPSYLANDSLLSRLFTKTKIGTVTIYDVASLLAPTTKLDTVRSEGFVVIRDEKSNFSPKMLIFKTLIKPNSIYNERLVERTYSSLNSLQAIKYVDISFREEPDGKMGCNIVVTPAKIHSVALDVEGTNSNGDLGMGMGISYQNKNIFKGAEAFRMGVHGSYEAIGKLGDIKNSAELGGNMAITLPIFLVPFTSNDFKRKMGGTTEFSMSYNFQQRPEYKRNIANAGMKYAWRYRGTRFTLDVIDVNYIYLPWMTTAFKEQYLKPSSSVRYSYEDHFIMRMGLGVSYSNKRNSVASNFYTLRGNVSTAGNLLYGISSAIGQTKNADNQYEIFNIAYSQYVKGDFDYTYNHYFNKRNRLVFHSGIGIAYPYGNATILPFEERYFSGGANSVRGWSVRTLGPGRYVNTGAIDYMNQSGDIRIDLNLEARFKLFWMFEGAAFIDAGNIWTIKDYEEQEGGYFQLNEFYKQIACSYGIGIRADFDFFVIRFDMGVKLYEPSGATSNDRWRTELSWKNDVAFHFAVGYPF